MSSSRFVVIKLKDIIKTTLFIAAAVVFVFAIIIFISKTGTRHALYNPGTYTTNITFANEAVPVSVTVDRNEITDIVVASPSETVMVFYPLFSSSAESVSAQIIETQSLELSSYSTNPVTDSLILDAVSQCLSQAKQ